MARRRRRCRNDGAIVAPEHRVLHSDPQLLDNRWQGSGAVEWVPCKALRAEGMLQSDQSGVDAHFSPCNGTTEKWGQSRRRKRKRKPNVPPPPPIPPPPPPPPLSIPPPPPMLPPPLPSWDQPMPWCRPAERIPHWTGSSNQEHNLECGTWSSPSTGARISCPFHSEPTAGMSIRVQQAMEDTTDYVPPFCDTSFGSGAYGHQYRPNLQDGSHAGQQTHTRLCQGRLSQEGPEKSLLSRPNSLVGPSRQRSEFLWTKREAPATIPARQQANENPEAWSAITERRQANLPFHVLHDRGTSTRTSCDGEPQHVAPLSGRNVSPVVRAATSQLFPFCGPIGQFQGAVSVTGIKRPYDEEGLGRRNFVSHDQSQSDVLHEGGFYEYSYMEHTKSEPSSWLSYAPRLPQVVKSPDHLLVDQFLLDDRDLFQRQFPGEHSEHAGTSQIDSHSISSDLITPAPTEVTCGLTTCANRSGNVVKLHKSSSCVSRHTRVLPSKSSDGAISEKSSANHLLDEEEFHIPSIDKLLSFSDSSPTGYLRPAAPQSAPSRTLVDNGSLRPLTAKQFNFLFDIPDESKCSPTQSDIYLHGQSSLFQPRQVPQAVSASPETLIEGTSSNLFDGFVLDWQSSDPPSAPVDVYKDSFHDNDGGTLRKAHGSSSSLLGQAAAVAVASISSLRPLARTALATAFGMAKQFQNGASKIHDNDSGLQKSPLSK